MRTEVIRKAVATTVGKADLAAVMTIVVVSDIVTTAEGGFGGGRREGGFGHREGGFGGRRDDRRGGFGGGARPMRRDSNQCVEDENELECSVIRFFMQNKDNAEINRRQVVRASVPPAARRGTHR